MVQARLAMLFFAMSLWVIIALSVSHILEVKSRPIRAVLVTLVIVVFYGLDISQMLVYGHLAGSDHVLKDDSYFYWPFVAEQLVALGLIFFVIAKRRSERL